MDEEQEIQQRRIIKHYWKGIAIVLDCYRLERSDVRILSVRPNAICQGFWNLQFQMFEFHGGAKSQGKG
jgi:hypothetical protein